MSIRARLARLSEAANVTAVVVPAGFRCPEAGVEPGGDPVERLSPETIIVRVPDRASNLDFAAHLDGRQRRALNGAARVWVMLYVRPETRHMEAAPESAAEAMHDPGHPLLSGDIVHLPIRHDPARDMAWH